MYSLSSVLLRTHSLFGLNTYYLVNYFVNNSHLVNKNNNKLGNTMIKMIKIDGIMNAVDTATGEIVNHSFPVLPEAYNTTPAVESVLFGDAEIKGIVSNISTSLKDGEKKETRGRKAKLVVNPFASLFANASYNEDTGECSLGSKMEDVLYSIASLSTGNTRIPVKQLMYVLKCEELSTKAVQEHLNKRRALHPSDEEEIGERYAQSLVRSAECVVKRLQDPESASVFEDMPSCAFNFEVDTVAYTRSEGTSNAVVCPIEFTEGDKETLRRLAIAGLDAQLESHIEQITQQSGRMMRRIEGQVVPLEQVYEAISNEFPYEVALEVVEPEPVFLDADDAYIDSVLNGTKAQTKEPDDWGVAFQSSSYKYTNELGEEW